mgnify:CR=1 FL=1
MTFAAQRTRRRAPYLRCAAWTTAISALVGAFAGCASATEFPSPEFGLATPIPLRADAAKAYRDAELSEYDVYLGPLRVGVLSYRTTATTADGRPAFLLEGTTKPTSIFAPFFKAAGTTRSLVTPPTFRPVVSSWVTTDAANPRTRLVAFDADAARSTTYESSWTMSRVVPTTDAFDPVSAMFILRALEPPASDGERRMFVLEGASLHLMTVRWEGADTIRLRPGGDDIPAMRFSVRGDRLDDGGALTSDPPVNSFRVWLDDAPGREILKLEGRIAFGGVSIVLRRDDAQLPRTGSPK